MILVISKAKFKNPFYFILTEEMSKISSFGDKSENLEHTLKKEEICLGHLIKYKIVCEKCEKSDNNKYCPYYRPSIEKNK